MSSSEEKIEEFEALLLKLCDHPLDEREQERLRDILSGGEYWLDRYVAFMNVHTSLSLLSQTIMFDRAEQHSRNEIADETNQTSGNKPDAAGSSPSRGFASLPTIPNSLESSGYPGQSSSSASFLSDVLCNFRNPSVLFLIAVTFAISTIGTVWWMANRELSDVAKISRGLNQKTLSDDPEDTSRMPHGVATLTTTAGCQWGGVAKNSYFTGRNINQGEEIALHEGIAAFRLESGVQLNVEGPASLFMTSPTTAVLQYGKLIAKIPVDAGEFEVLASTYRVNASDAEIGIDVSKERIRIHSFSGESVVQSTPFDIVNVDALIEDRDDNLQVSEEADIPAGSGFSKARIAKNRSLSLAKSGEKTKVLQWSPADKFDFTAMVPLNLPLNIGNDYASEVLALKPIHYWRFESLRDQKITNEVSGKPSLRLRGNLLISGDDNNHFAEFGFGGSNTLLSSEEPIDEIANRDYSVEVWVKPLFSQRGGVVGLVPTTDDMLRLQRGHYGFLIELRNKMEIEQIHTHKPAASDAVRFLHRSPPGKLASEGTNCWSSISIRARQWHHVVAVKKGPLMQLYINGNLASENKDSSQMAASLFAIVGQTSTVEGPKQFFGQLDELAIYNHALSIQDISMHWNAAKSNTDHSASLDMNSL